MLEQVPRHLANKYEDIVNLQGAEAYCVATRTACFRDNLGENGPIFVIFCSVKFTKGLWSKFELKLSPPHKYVALRKVT